MKDKSIIVAAFIAFACSAALLLYEWGGVIEDEAIPAGPEVVQEAPSPITTEEAISYLEQGEAIVLLATDAFSTAPSTDLGRTLLMIADEYNVIMGGLCKVEGTQATCKKASETLVLAYEALFAYAKEQGQ